MYCITIYDEHFDKIKDLGYIPVGLGNKIFSKKFLTDTTKKNISEKNPFYGEYTFHYWLWKNKIIKNEKNWIGFCQYRKFWIQKNYSDKYDNLNQLNKDILKKIPEEINEYESILGEPIFVNQFRLSKFLKNNFKTMIKRPYLFFNKSKRTLKFHFDMMHGKEISIKQSNFYIKKTKMILKNSSTMKYHLILTICLFVNQVRY